jgi:hypothetical protein
VVARVRGGAGDRLEEVGVNRFDHRTTLTSRCS